MNDYIADALRTEVATSLNLTLRQTRLLHAGIGIATEGGEFLDALKKNLFYGKPLDHVNLREEIGDICWYLAIALNELETTFESVQRVNIEKLKARYPDKFTSENALSRNLEAERAILEGRP
jgi:NTP pyrophosphatase (non-canonical NTP hydrolase)